MTRKHILIMKMYTWKNAIYPIKGVLRLEHFLIITIVFFSPTASLFLEREIILGSKGAQRTTVGPPGNAWNPSSCVGSPGHLTDRGSLVGIKRGIKGGKGKEIKVFSGRASVLKRSNSGMKPVTRLLLYHIWHLSTILMKTAGNNSLASIPMFLVTQS